MNQLAYSLLLVLAGWLLRGALGGRWRSNPRNHHLADARHRWVEIGGVWHAFTDDALVVARARAEHLAPLLPHRWRTRILWAVLAAGVLLMLTGCVAATSAKVWWNPLTWGKDRAASVERVAAKQDANDTALVKQAQVENAKTIEALKEAPASRPVEVASRTAENAQTLLDRAVGSITVQDLTDLRQTVANLLSENAGLRATGEKQQAKAEATAARLTAENEDLKAQQAESVKKLQAGYERERQLANTVRNFWFIGGGLALLWILGNLLSVAARFNPGLAGVSRVVNGVAAPALAFAEARAADGLQKVGHALARAREAMPEAAEKLVTILDTETDRDHQRAIGAAANTAPRT